VSMLEQAHTLLAEVYRADPDSAQAARDVSVSLNKLADVLGRRGQTGDAEKALELFEESLGIRRRLLNPAVAASSLDYFISLHNVAATLLRRKQPGDAERALALTEERLGLCKALYESAPLVPRYAQALMDAYMFMAQVMKALGRYKDIIKLSLLANGTRDAFHEQGQELQCNFENNYKARIKQGTWIVGGALLGLLALLGGGGYLLYRWLR